MTTTIPLAKLHESPKNPRRTFTGLEELADSLKRVGQMQPIIVREHPELAGEYEIAAGHRRRRAALLAKLPSLEAIVRKLSNAEMLECMLVENGQRADVPPLEEAETFRQLRDDHKYSVEEIAAKTAKSPAHVYQRLRLARLHVDVRALVEKGHLTLAGALEISRLEDVNEQAAAVAKLEKDFRFARERNGTHLIGDVRRVVAGLTRKLAGAPWALDDAHLVAAAGACTACPKRTHAQAVLFQIGVVEDGDSCTDPTCWEQKAEAFTTRAMERALENGQDLVEPKEAKKLLPKRTASYGPPPEFVDLGAPINELLGHNSISEARAAGARKELAGKGDAALEKQRDDLEKQHGKLEDRQMSVDLDEAEEKKIAAELLALDKRLEDLEEQIDRAATWARAVGLDHPAIRVAVIDGVARSICALADLITILDEKGFGAAAAALRCLPAPLPAGAPLEKRLDRQTTDWARDAARSRAEATTLCEGAVAAATAKLASLKPDEVVPLLLRIVVLRADYDERGGIAESCGLRADAGTKKILDDGLPDDEHEATAHVLRGLTLLSKEARERRFPVDAVSAALDLDLSKLRKEAKAAGSRALAEYDAKKKGGKAAKDDAGDVEELEELDEAAE